ncbi:MAG: autotransporter outer membrane beta-barrel domain-containing protein [Nonlabens sp.]
MKYLTLFFILLAIGANAQIDEITKGVDSAQIPVHLREIPRHNIVVTAGIAQPLGDYKFAANAGLNLGVGYDYYFNKSFGLSSQLSHSYNEYGIARANFTDLTIQGDDNFTATSITMGAQYSYTSRRFQLDLFARGGVAFLNEINNTASATGAGDIIVNVFDYNANESLSTAAVIESGLRLNYYFRRNVQLFFSPQVTTTLGDSITYNTGINNDLSTVNFANLTFNVGLKFSLGKTYSNGEQRLD